MSVNLPGIESRDARQQASRSGTAGRAIPGVAIRIVDAESFAPLAPGREGLLLARGPGRMLGYVDDAEGTRDVLRDGWIVTGDRAVVDKDAFVTITRPRAARSRA